MPMGSLSSSSTAAIAGKARGLSSSSPASAALSLLRRQQQSAGASLLLRQPARWMATNQGGSSAAFGANASGKQQQQHKDEEKQNKEQDKEDEERREEERERESRGGGSGGGGGGYKQEVNAFQKLLAVGIPVTAIVLGVKVLMDMQATGAEDDTLQVDMNVIMGHVFQSTVYNVLDSKKLTTLLGDPLLVEPSKAKFSFTKDSAWVCYPLYAPNGLVCTVTIDVLRVDPNGKDVNPKHKKPHLWYVAQVEVDLNNGKKMLMSTKMEGLRQPFNVLTLFGKLYHDLKKQEQEFLQQQAAASLRQDPSAPQQQQQQVA
jgi:hypothetical protein